MNVTFLPSIIGVPSTASLVSGESHKALPGSVIEPASTLPITVKSKIIACP